MKKSKRVVKHGCYSASNEDLGIKDKNCKLTEWKHDVFAVSKVSKKGFVKVKTITSFENKNTGTIQRNSILNIKNGRVIAISDKELNSDRLSGIHPKPIWIYKSKLSKSKFGFKYPSKYNFLINIDKR